MISPSKRIKKCLGSCFLLWWMISCQLSENPDTFSFRPNLADSLSQYDSVIAILKTTEGQTLDTLFKGKVKSPSDLDKLEAPHYKGGTVLIVVIGFEKGVIKYNVEKVFDGNKDEVK